MASCKSWDYPDNSTVRQFKKAFPENGHINQWYQAGDKIIYMNSKFYYHMVVIKRCQLGMYLADYVLSKDGKLRHSKDYGYFTQKELIEFLKDKGIVI